MPERIIYARAPRKQTPNTGKPCPIERAFALLDVTLVCTPDVVKRQYALVQQAAVGDDEADPREQFAGMELDFGDNAAGLRPTLRSIVEASVVAQDMVWGLSGPSSGQPVDPFVELRIILEPDGVISALGLQHPRKWTCNSGHKLSINSFYELSCEIFIEFCKVDRR